MVEIWYLKWMLFEVVWWLKNRRILSRNRWGRKNPSPPTADFFHSIRLRFTKFLTDWETLPFSALPKTLFVVKKWPIFNAPSAPFSAIFWQKIWDGKIYFIRILGIWLNLLFSFRVTIFNFGEQLIRFAASHCERSEPPPIEFEEKESMINYNHSQSTGYAANREFSAICEKPTKDLRSESSLGVSSSEGLSKIFQKYHFVYDISVTSFESLWASKLNS